MFSNHFSGTDRRVLAALTLLLVAGVVFSLYRKSGRTVSPTLLLSTIEIPPPSFSKTRASTASSHSDNRLDLNRADTEQLQELPGIGPALAWRIVEYREKKGGFGSVQELLRVSGIGPKKLARLKENVYLSQPAAQSRASSVGAEGTHPANRAAPDSSLVSSNSGLK